MEQTGLPEYKNPPPPPKRKRRKGVDAVIEHFKKLDLMSQLDVVKTCNKIIDERREVLQKDLELITSAK
jgi:hypothetical protein